VTPDPSGPPERIGRRCWRIPLPDPFPPGVTSAFLLELDGGTRWLLDAGADTEASAEKLRAGLRRLAAPSPEEPAGVILSHSHLDHAGGLLRWRPPLLAAHERCVAEMRNREAASSRGAEALRRMGVPEAELASLLPPRDDAPAASLAEIPVDLALRGDRGPLPAGGNWSWILAEGHAPGHLMMFEPVDRVLLVGDQFLVRWKTPYRITDPDEDAFGLHLASLDAAIGLEPEVICSSHTDAVRPAVPWLEERKASLLRQVERTREAAAAGGVSAWDVVAGRPGGQVSGGLRVLLLREQLAILRHLAAGGALERGSDGTVERFGPA
jgi:glyoxylase-like metal-dependent hydrolase (beta-lactamase superfamily II)